MVRSSSAVQPIRRRFDVPKMAGWQPHHYAGPPSVSGALFRGMGFALLPAAAFWSGLAVATYWMMAAR